MKTFLCVLSREFLRNVLRPNNMSTSPSHARNPFRLEIFALDASLAQHTTQAIMGAILNERDLLTGDASFGGMKESGNETFIDALRVWKENSRRSVCISHRHAVHPLGTFGFAHAFQQLFGFKQLLSLLPPTS